MSNDCLQLPTLVEIKKCLQEKIGTLHAANTRFHTDILNAIVDADTALSDLRYAELKGVLAELTKANQSSIGKFLIDLTLTIVFGPVLGTVAGKLISGPVTNLVVVRGGLDRFSSELGLKKIVTSNTSAIEALAERGIRQLKIPVETITYELNEVTTGVVIDTFELLWDKIEPLGGSMDGVTLVTGGTQSFKQPPMDYEPGPSEFVRRQARLYYDKQTRINEITRSILQWLVANASNKESLAMVAGVIDQSLQRIASYDGAGAVREINNLAKVTLILFNWGDPYGWSKDRASLVGPDRVREQERDPTLIYGIQDAVEYLDVGTVLPPALQQKIVKTICEPGTNSSYFAIATREKRKALGRPRGYGLDYKLPYSGREPFAPQEVAPQRYDTEWYTVEEVAFYRCRQFMKQIFSELTSKEYDNRFLSMLERRNLLVP